MKDARIIFECYCYEVERPDRKVDLLRPTWQLVYAFISLGTEDYKPRLVENPDYRPHSYELRYKSWQEEFNVDKGDGSEAVNIKVKVPRWDFVGIEPTDGSKHFVHLGSKRRFFCQRLLNNFSSEESTILDFFSRGVFAREALLSNGDVIYFSSSQLEVEFMAKYGKLLHTHSDILRFKFQFLTSEFNFYASPGRVLMTCVCYAKYFFFSLEKCAQISYQSTVVEEDESNPQGDQSNPQVIEGGGSGLVQEFDQGASTTHNEQGASTTQNEQGASTAQEPRTIGTPQSGEEFPLANILSQARSVEANDIVSLVQPSDRNINSEPIEVPIEGIPVTADNAADEVSLAVDEGRLEDDATAVVLDN
ncbi:hypothetical protein R1sor_025823 [Riccia sorocarpa]|uniref:Uncharacterized protein n=1 Tax=Riccia sorocarpa TaxID=122646 RepID=A0ABD3GCR2_9MARC